MLQCASGVRLWLPLRPSNIARPICARAANCFGDQARCCLCTANGTKWQHRFWSQPACAAKQTRPNLFLCEALTRTGARFTSAKRPNLRKKAGFPWPSPCPARWDGFSQLVLELMPAAYDSRWRAHLPDRYQAEGFQLTPWLQMLLLQNLSAAWVPPHRSLQRSCFGRTDRLLQNKALWSHCRALLRRLLRDCIHTASTAVGLPT